MKLQHSSGFNTHFLFLDWIGLSTDRETESEIGCYPIGEELGIKSGKTHE